MKIIFNQKRKILITVVGEEEIIKTKGAEIITLFAYCVRKMAITQETIGTNEKDVHDTLILKKIVISGKKKRPIL